MIKLIVIVFSSILLSLTLSRAAPSNNKKLRAEKEIYNDDHVELPESYVITIEHFESLLQRATEIFNPARFHTIPNTKIMQQPNQQMQPPSQHPFNFYLPLFNQYDGENTKLDEKSQKLQKITIPLQQDETNYYAIKQKKTPKKYNPGIKLINLKWLNTYEKDALAGTNGKMPKSTYTVDDDRNRINFDDSFFADNFYINSPDNQPYKDISPHDKNNEMGEDLITASAVQSPQIYFNYHRNER